MYKHTHTYTHIVDLLNSLFKYSATNKNETKNKYQILFWKLENMQ